MKVDYPKLLDIGKQLLVALDEDPDRPELRETPRRFADSWREFIEYHPGKVETVFESVSTNQMVVVSGMRVWSMCEHHLLPFWCDISIAYITRKKVLGLSKFARIAHLYAHSLQIQERLVTQIGDEITRLVGHDDVAVLGRGEHLCMTMRGIKTPSRMISSYLRGVFMEDPTVRAEFLNLAKE